MKCRALLCAALAVVANGASKPSLEAFLTFPNREQLVSSSGSLVAWVSIVAGVPNIYGASTLQPSNAFVVTNNTGDDGMAFANLQFVGDHLVYTYGPDEDANPRHNIVPPDYHIYTAACAAIGSSSNRGPLTLSQHSPGRLLAVSPKRKDGSQGVLYAAADSVGVAVREISLADGRSFGADSFVFATKHGSISSVAWSSDGETLAFTNYRFDHAFVGLFHRGYAGNKMQ